MLRREGHIRRYCQVRFAVAWAHFFCLQAMSSDSQGVQHYVGRFDGAESDDFHIVTSASLEGSEVQMWSGSADKGPVYTLTDASQSVAWQSEDPPKKKYRAVLEPVRPRNEENVPEGVDITAWLKGCSTVPVPGFHTKLRFLLAPQQYWTRVELWVHPTTTVGDAKHFLEAQSFPHGQAELFGTETKTKLGWREPLLVASEKNWSPLEDRVVVPSTTRLDMPVCECGCSQWLLGLLHDMTPRPYCKMWGSRLFACACQGRARAGPRGLVRQAGVLESLHVSLVLFHVIEALLITVDLDGPTLPLRLMRVKTCVLVECVFCQFAVIVVKYYERF